MAIIAADGFKISKTNTPTREGERIATLADITDREKVPNPSVGMQIFVEDEQAHYIVLELGPAEIGGIEVPNLVVKRYKKLEVEVEDGSISKKKLSSDVQKEFETLNSQITALSAGLKASLTVSPNVVHKNTATQITLNGSLKDNAGNVVADNILIKKGDDMIAENTNESSIFALYSLNASSDTAFSVDIGIKGMTLSAKATVSARNPVYAGMGTSAISVAVAANKQSARTSAKGYTYTKKATADGQYFFLLVPSDVTKPTAFTMGGVPFAMEAGTTETINEINYTVYRSSSVYNNGAEVTVTAN